MLRCDLQQAMGSKSQVKDVSGIYAGMMMISNKLSKGNVNRIQEVKVVSL